jgi:HEAT repeat protein
MDRAAINRLIVAFNGRDESRWPGQDDLPAILQGLVEALDGPAVVEAIRTGGPQTRNAAISVVSRVGQQAIAPIAALLRDGDPNVRATAADALECAGDDAKDAVGALVIALGDREPAVRAAAAAALGAIDSGRATSVPSLIATLDDADADVRRSAMRALARFGPGARDAIPSLIAALDGVGSDAAVSALVAIGEAAIPALVVALGHPDRPRVRLGAADALGLMRQRLEGPDTTQAVAALVAALDNHDPALRLYAAVALRNMGNEARRHVPARWRDFVATAFIDRGFS